MGFVLKLRLRGFYVYGVRLAVVVDHVTMLGSVGLGSDQTSDVYMILWSVCVYRFAEWICVSVLLRSVLCLIFV